MVFPFTKMKINACTTHLIEKDFVKEPLVKFPVGAAKNW
jgi:hypothetical protein